jgi:DNA repair exonuclease SbcCD ATPase subunit
MFSLSEKPSLEQLLSTYPPDEITERLFQQNSALTSSLKETLEKVDQQQRCIEELLNKLQSVHYEVPEEGKELEIQENPEINELLAKIKYQADLISELENKNAELEGRFNRIRVKNNQLESQTKKYSENVEKVFKDVNKKLQVIEKSLANKEEKIKAIYNDYARFKQKYITGFQEKSKALLNSIMDPKNEEIRNSLMSQDLDKDDLIKLLRQRVEFLQEKIDALVKSNFMTKELIENISDKAHDAIEMIKVD